MDNNNDSWVFESKTKEIDSTKVLFLQKICFGLDLDILEEELENFWRKFVTVNLNFIETRDKCYKIYDKTGIIQIIIPYMNILLFQNNIYILNDTVNKN